jgi:hypothetical protein
MRIIILLCLLLSSAMVVSAQENPPGGLRDLAAKLGDHVKRAIGDKPIRVGFFTPTGIDHSNSSGAFMEAVMLALGSSVNSEAKLELKGEYAFVTDDQEPAFKVIRIEASIKDLNRGGNFKEFGSFEGTIWHNADIARLVGAQLSTPRNAYWNARIASAYNREIAVFAHLDGIDQFAFSENRKPDGRPQFQSWIVDPGKDITIKGWHKNVDPGEVFGFLTTEAGKGAASKFPTQSLGKTGTICVSIAYAKPEADSVGTGFGGGAGLETTTGVPIGVKQEALKRNIDYPHEVVTIRYSR